MAYILLFFILKETGYWDLFHMHLAILLNKFSCYNKCNYDSWQRVEDVIVGFHLTELYLWHSMKPENLSS